MKLPLISSVKTHILASTKLFMGLDDWMVVAINHHNPMDCSAMWCWNILSFRIWILYNHSFQMDTEPNYQNFWWYRFLSIYIPFIMLSNGFEQISAEIRSGLWGQVKRNILTITLLIQPAQIEQIAPLLLHINNFPQYSEQNRTCWQIFVHRSNMIYQGIWCTSQER